MSTSLSISMNEDKAILNPMTPSIQNDDEDDNEDEEEELEEEKEKSEDDEDEEEDDLIQRSEVRPDHA